MPRRPPTVARVLERVTSTIRSHEMFEPGETVLAAVSGGPDSICLLHALHMLRRLLRIRLAVFHFDHRLRPDSARDAEYVRRTADKLRLPFHLREADSAPGRGESMEDWARRARLRALAETLRAAPASRAAVGHTQDDQAETVLLAIVRGGGLQAVAGIRPAHGPYVRPLIETSRAEVEAFNRSLRLRPRQDPTNRDTRLLRNAVRLKVIPALERAVGREVKVSMARTGVLLSHDEEYLSREAGALAEDLIEEDADGVLLPSGQLSPLPRALSARVVRLALLRAGVLPTVEYVEAVLDLAWGRTGRRVDLPGPLIAKKEREYVRLSRSSPGETADEPRARGGRSPRGSRPRAAGGGEK
jgi:tRNA(Ile)-lysidine synthase